MKLKQTMLIHCQNYPIAPHLTMKARHYNGWQDPKWFCSRITSLISCISSPETLLPSHSVLCYFLSMELKHSLLKPDLFLTWNTHFCTCFHSDSSPDPIHNRTLPTTSTQSPLFAFPTSLSSIYHPMCYIFHLLVLFLFSSWLN